MNNLHSFSIRLRHSPICRLTAVTLVALAWGNSAAADTGAQLRKVRSGQNVMSGAPDTEAGMPVIATHGKAAVPAARKGAARKVAMSKRAAQRGTTRTAALNADARLFHSAKPLVKGQEVNVTGLVEFNTPAKDANVSEPFARLKVANGEYGILLDSRGRQMASTLDGKRVVVRGVLTGQATYDMVSSFSSPSGGAISGSSRVPELKVETYKPAQPGNHRVLHAGAVSEGHKNAAELGRQNGGRDPRTKVTNTQRTRPTSSKPLDATAVVKQAPAKAAGNPTPAEAAGKKAASAEEYRDLRREDGFNFGAYVAEMQFSFGGAPSGTLTKFGLVDDAGNFYELELETKEFKGGEIKTKLLGVVRALSSGPTSMSYALTESQIKKARAYLAEQK